MNKPTDDELNELAFNEGNRALHDAGIAHGWREAIEALRRVPDDDQAPSRDCAECCVEWLERIAKERG